MFSRPPGTLPLAGNGIWFLQPRHKLLDWFSQCERQSGLSTFEISVPSLPPAIVINDPSNVEHVLKNHELFIKGHFFRARSWDLFGTSARIACIANNQQPVRAEFKGLQEMGLSTPMGTCGSFSEKPEFASLAPAISRPSLMKYGPAI